MRPPEIEFSFQKLCSTFKINPLKIKVIHIVIEVVKTT